MKIGIVAHKYFGSKEATMKETAAGIREVVRAGAQLVVLQELHQSEYFCQIEDVAKFDYAAEFERDKDFWSQIARIEQVVLVTSLFEKRAAGLYHNTAVVFDKNGSVAGTYRKMHIPDDPHFYEKFYFTPGDLGFEPIDTSVGRLGVMVCWDQWYPEAARLMALKGADILIYPTAIGWLEEESAEEKNRQLEAWVAVQRGHAVANGLPVVAVNRVGFEPSPKGKGGINFWGNSFIFGPQGEQIYRSNEFSLVAETIDVDLKKCENVRRWWPFLRDRRIECYEGLTKRFLD